MATTKSNWTFIALLLTLFILETQNFTELTLQVPQDYLNEPGLPYRREKRDVSVQQDKAEYEVDVELNLTDSRTVEYLRNFLKNTKFILTLDPSVNITQVDLTTVCYINGTNIECKCEDQYVWPKSSCFTYGACDEVTDSTCGCINKIPSDGSSCQPKSAFVYQYRLDIQINIKDTEQLRSAFANLTFPRQIRSDVNISDADVTTICSPAGSDIQCRCENNYLWPCDRCTTYRKCDEGSACGCIQTVPTDGQFCQSELNNLTVCPSTTLVPSLEYSSTVTTKTTPDVTTTVTDSSTISTEISTTTPDVTTPRTDPLPVYEYVISVDLNTTGVTVINRFRNILENFTYPYSINGNTQINQANISTVCSPVSDGYQCRCEDQYQWSCDQCQMYGACDQISEDSCGCIKAIPSDGNFCQSVDQHNFTACPTTTILASTYFSTAATEIFTTTPDVKTTATDFSSTVPEIFTTKQDVTTTVTDPPPVYTYSISVELNITDMKAITKMRDILGTISYPYTISGNTQINQANISTVCSPVSDGYQCRCEDQYQWSCDQCQMYGACDQISADSCGCIKAIPSDGNFCQSVDQHNFTVCPLSTTSSTFSTLSPSASTEILTTMPNVNTTMTEAPPAYRYLISVELNTTALMAINTLRSFLGNIAYPFSINKQTQINRANISTVCSPVSDGYQCRCEDQYQWSCDQCQMYGACDQISENSCGCIKAIPSDGNFCQSVDQHNFTLCPTTSTPSTILSYTSLTPTELFTTLPDMTTTMTEPPPAYRYLISVELNTTALTALNTLRSILGNIVYPFSINSQTQINRANISTVCFPVSDGYQCRCENQYMWSCDQCLTYGACDQISENSCGCINSIPSDGNFCQSLDQYNFTLCPTTTPSTILTFSPSASTEILTTMPDVTTTMTEPPPAYRYLISVELNTTALTALNTLRSILGNIVYPFSINSQTQINRANISTVCSPLSDGYQCRCEDQYQWSCDQCQMYGACDQISEDSCGCIKAIPSDGNFCQSVDQHNFTLCPTTTPTTVLTYSSSTPTELFTTTADVTTLTTAEPPPLYKYFLSVELNTTDVIVINKLRSILENISYPLSINRQTRINYANISTVCSPVSDGYQCRCEDQYQWSCDQCQMYGACDQISEDSCGCIKAIPSDGNFCQSVDQNNFTLCPSAIPSTISTYYSPTPTALFTTTADVTTTMTAEPPPLYRYFLSVELNTTDVIVINKLRSVLENISYPLSINSQTRINYANISTVCSPVSDGYQCRCEDQYQWSCDQCQMYGACDQISEDSCGCIKAIPSDGNFCQSVDQHNFTVCPLTPTPSPLTTYSPPVSTEIFTTTVDVTTITASSSVTTETFTTAQDGTTAMTEPPPLYKYVLSVELNTTDVIVIDKLRRVLENISYPLSITSQTRINYANISTVCSPVSDGYQCRCEDQYKWSCDQCQMYGACDQISENSCGCIKAIPSDGNFCQSLNQNNFTVCAPTPTPDPLLTSSPSVTTEIITTVPDVTTTVTESPTVTTEILTTTVEVTTPTTDSPSVTTKVDTTTVDVTTTMTEPPPLYKYVLSVELNTTDVIVINKLRSVLENISYPLSINSQTQINYANISTVCSPVSDGYQCRCEDQYQWSCDQCQMYGACDQISEDSCGCVKAIPSDGNFCQSLYQNNFTVCPPTPTPIPLTTYLPSVSTEIITTTVDVTTITVSPSVTTEAFTTAQQVTTTMTVSPSMTTEAFTTAQQVTTTMTDSPSVTTEIFTTVPDVTTIMTGSPSVTTKLFTTKADLTTPTTDSPVTTKLFTTRADVTTPTTELPLPVYNYRVSVELNTTEITVIDKLRSILGNITYLPSISRLIRISWANISTVCSPVSGGYQCKCEDHYHWSCDQCQMYGACDQISENSCGCVNAIPPDGDFCQPRDQLNLTACLVETTTPSTSTAWTSQSFKTTGDNSMTSVNTTETTNSSTPPIISPTTGVSTLIYTTTEDPTTASSTVTLTTRDDTTTMMSTVSPTIMETTTAVSTVISTTTEEPTTLVSTVIHTTNEQPTTPVSTVVSTPTEETTARSTVTPSTTKTQTSSVTMDFPIRTETTTKAVSKGMTTTAEASTFTSTTETQTSPLATMIPTTIEATTNAISTVFLTTEEPSTAVTTLTSTTTARPTTVASTMIPTTIEATTNALSTVFSTTEEPSTAIITLTSTTETQTSPFTTLLPTIARPTTVASTMIPTTIEATTNALSTVFSTTEEPSTAVTTLTSTTETQTSPFTTLLPTTARPTTVASTMIPTTIEDTTIAVSTVFPTTEEPSTAATTLISTTETQTLPFTTLMPTTARPTTVASTMIPTTIEDTTIAVSTVFPTTEEPSTAATTLIFTTETQTLPFTTLMPTTARPLTVASTMIPTTIEDTTIAVTTVFLTTEEPSTAATTRILTTARPTTTGSTIIPTTNEETTTAVSTSFSTPDTQTLPLTTFIPTTIKVTSNAASTVFLTTEKPSTAATTLIPTTARPTTAASTVIPTINEETTTAVSTFFSTPEAHTSTLTPFISPTIEATTYGGSTVFLTTEKPSTAATTLIPTTARPTIAASTVIPSTNEETTTAVSTSFSTPDTQTLPLTTFIPTTIKVTSNAASTVFLTTEKPSTAATTLISTTKTYSSLFTTVIPTTNEETTTAVSTVFLTTVGPSTAASTLILTTARPTTAAPTVIPTTNEETTTAVSTVTPTTIKKITMAISTYIPTTTEESTFGPTTINKTVIFPSTFVTSAKVPTTAVIPTTTTIPTFAISTEITTALSTTIKTVIPPITKATTAKTTTKLSTAANITTVTTSVLITTPTTKNFPITTITTSTTSTTASTTPTKTTNLTNNTTKTITTTTTTKPTTTTTTKPTTTTTKATMTTTTDKATMTTTTAKATTTTTTAKATTTTTPTKATMTTITDKATMTTITAKATTTTITAKATTTTTTAKATTTTTTTTKATTTTTTTTKATTTAKTTTTTTASAGITAIDIEVSVTFDMEFKDAFNDKSSAEYKSLEDKISTELQRQYETITGFVRVIVTGFRRGSVIADFVISTAEGSATQITQANKNLTNTLKSIAPVLKSTALYKSSRNITYITYTPPILTGKTMELQCGPPDGDLLAIVGNIKSAQWKADGIKILSGTRQTFTIVSNTSVLTVNNLINKDAGLYECILSGTNSDFYQNITVKRDDIKAAPLLEMTPKLSVECKTSTKVSLDCCVQSNYVASLVNPPTEVQILEPTTSNEKYCVKYEYTIPSCSSNPQPITFKCKVDGYNGYEKTTTLNFFTGAPTCTSNIYGQGQEGATSTIVCPGGTKTAQCKAGSWIVITDNCILPVIKDLLTESADLVPEKVETFSNDLKKTVKDNKTEIAKSSKSVSTIVDIVKTIANVSTFVTTEIITNVLQTIDVLTDDSVKQSWETLNKDRNDNAASRLLGSLETLSQALSGTADVSTERIHLIRTNATEFKPSNSTVSIEIQDSDGVFNNNTFMTIIILNTFNNVMPARNSSFDLNLFNGTSNETTSANNANLAINAAVVLVQVNQTVPSVNFKFIALNENLTKETQCVFWNFTLLENFGAWDDEGCKFVSRENDTVICNCSHLTSFSVLMSTDISLFVNKPPGSGSGSGGSSPGGSGGGQGATITAAGFILDIITYIGVAISLASLVICLIIEGYVWRAVTKNTTALMRHISIVNTALSLLIADICFIIAASYSQKAINNTDGDFKGLIGQCTAVTFFMHFFYLALFFWMLVSGLLLFYRTVMVFSHMSKSIMIAIGFVVGYGCPLIIAVTTVAATAPSQTYIRKNYICWLNWTESKALLSLVIPALVIVVINIIVVIVVLCKMMRRSSGNTVQPDEKNSFVVIIRCLAILTPLFGLTWALGIGTMVSPKDLGIHIAFAFFNSLQGFFILVFGTLFDSKIRALLSSRMPSTNSNSTGSTSAGTSSFGGLVSRLRGRNVYQVSQPRNSGNTNSSSESYSMI
ncbi:mucin-3A isoform X4 [Oryzias melastigma]|uniref:mucin-3A isoform X4 n=1 Tax=Oryzias melastigma TaxID=30732 RepID=UPI00168D56A6|nr:mucin-3A isoform X4 [Oryzias melastigma]